MARFGEMYANLIASAGFQLHAHDRSIAELIDDFVMCNSQLTHVGIARRITIECFVGSQMAAECASSGRHPSSHDRCVFTMRLARLKLAAERVSDLERLGKHQQSRDASI